MLKVFTSGESPVRAGDDLTNQFNNWVESLGYNIEIISVHSNSNRWGWMMVVIYSV